MKICCAADRHSKTGYVLQDAVGRVIAEAVTEDVGREIEAALDAAENFECPECDGFGIMRGDFDLDNTLDDVESSFEPIAEYMRERAKAGDDRAEKLLHDWDGFIECQRLGE